MNERSKIPSSWIWTTLKEITDPVEKTQPRKNPNREFTYIDISSIDNKTNKIVEPKKYLGKNAPSRARQLIKGSDTLFSTVRVYLKNIAPVDEKYDGQIASTGFCVIRPTPQINSRYVFYYMLTQSVIDSLSKLQRGTSYPAVRNDDVFTQAIPIPPAAEQERIVSKIEELFSRLDAGVKSLMTSKTSIEQYRISLLRDTFRGNLTKKWRESHQIPGVLDSEARPEWLPDSWRWIKAGDAFEIILGQSPPSSTYNDEGIGLPFFQGSKEFGPIYPEIIRWCSEPIRIAEKGDVFISVRAPVGDTNICPERACIGRGLAAIRPKDDTQIIFILNLFRAMKNIFIRQGTGTTFSAITGTRFRNTRIPIPPQFEQQEILNILDTHLSVTTNTLRNLEISHKYAENLRSKILHSAFRGRLVPQNAEDEPADVLLDRIRKENHTIQSRLM